MIWGIHNNNSFEDARLSKIESDSDEIQFICHPAHVQEG